MPKESFDNSQQLSQMIKQRRQELNLTIEEAAQKANIGTKTWSRYEAGSPIRQDKIKGVIKALKWRSIPSELNNHQTLSDLIFEYKQHDAWSEFLSETYGVVAAISFCIGSDIISDYVNEDLNNLKDNPKGTHIGELDSSFISYLLPEQFLMEYNYEFMYRLSTVINKYRLQAKNGTTIIAHTVLEEICLYLIMEESKLLLSEMAEQLSEEELEEFDYHYDWAFDIFDDMDVYTFLYSDFYLTSQFSYHFDHWFEEQFYTNHFD